MKKIKSFIFMALAGLSFASCEDFLTLMPLNDIVLENFWTDKSDVESVLLGAYAALETGDCVTRMSVWGEMRADNMVYESTSQNTSDDIRQVVKENLMSSNGYTTYKCFYDVINRANTVLHFAPQVAAQDPNYTADILNSDIAEAIAIRSLSYWYLIRAFRDVPYTTIPSIDDTNDFFIGQTPFNQILDSLISDLEAVKDYATKKFTSESANTGRFTRVGIYALLVDMYLWKGNWDKCIEYSEYITSEKMKEYKELKEEEGTSCNVQLFNDKYPLIYDASNTNPSAGNSYNKIFGSGSSFETLFELPYDQTVSNPFVSTYYNDNNSKTGALKAIESISGGVKSGNLFSQQTDGRFLQDVNENGGIVKYVYESLTYNMKSYSDFTAIQSSTKRNFTQPNWIIYRYTDVLLMEAEAKVMKAMQLSGQDSTELCNDAFVLVDAVNSRAICRNSYENATALKQANYSDASLLETLVFDERRRELLFEGKRWFDLVRMALRDTQKPNGSTRRLIEAVQEKHQKLQTYSAVEIKLRNVDALFFPINKEEIKINSLLKQNPAYVDNEYINKAQ